jgi:hypothetical protein
MDTTSSFLKDSWVLGNKNPARTGVNDAAIMAWIDRSVNRTKALYSAQEYDFVFILDK